MINIAKSLDNKWIKLFFAFSASAFAGLVIGDGTKIGMVLNIPIAFGLTLFLEAKYNIMQRIFAVRSKRSALIAFPISIYILTEIAIFFQKQRVNRLFNSDETIAIIIRESTPEFILWVFRYFFTVFATLCALFFVFLLAYAIICRFKLKILPHVTDMWRTTDNIERWYFLVASTAFMVLLIVAYSLSSVFWSTQVAGDVPWDVLYNTDSGAKLDADMHFLGDGIARMLYALLNLPLSLIAKLFRLLLPFLPSAYSFGLQATQNFLILLMAIMITRSMNVKGLPKVFALIIYTITFPVLAFSIMSEQMILPSFYIVLTIYLWNKGSKLTPYITAVVTGSLLTSLFIVPFTTFDKNAMTWIKNILKIMMIFLIICVFWGKVGTVTDLIDGARGYSKFAESTIEDRGLQYINFAYSTLAYPESIERYEPFDPEDGSDVIPRMVFELAPCDSINIPGLIILVTSILGFALNRKDKFSIGAGYWLLFGFILLFVLGWDSSSNEMFLMSLYFSWAYFVLIFMLIEKLFVKMRAVRHTIYTTAIVVLGILNITGIADMLRFAIKYYPRQ